MGQTSEQVRAKSRLNFPASRAELRPALSKTLHALPPPLFVYAPGLAEPDQLHLAREGVVVDDGGPNSMIPDGPTDLAAVKQGLEDWFAESYSDWRVTDRGIIYEGARATWRMDRLPPLPSPPPGLPPEKAEPLAPSEDYRRLVAFLNGRTDIEPRSCG